MNPPTQERFDHRDGSWCSLAGVRGCGHGLSRDRDRGRGRTKVPRTVSTTYGSVGYATVGSNAAGTEYRRCQDPLLQDHVRSGLARTTADRAIARGEPRFHANSGTAVRHVRTSTPPGDGSGLL